MQTAPSPRSLLSLRVLACSLLTFWNSGIFNYFHILLLFLFWLWCLWLPAWLPTPQVCKARAERPKLREQTDICTRQKGRGTNRNCLGPELLILSILPFFPKRQPSCLLKFLLSFPAVSQLSFIQHPALSVSVLRKRGVSSSPLGTKGCIKVRYRQHVVLEHVA